MSEEVPYKLDQESLVKAGYRHKEDVSRMVRRVNRWVMANQGSHTIPPGHIMEKMSHFRRSDDD